MKASPKLLARRVVERERIKREVAYDLLIEAADAWGKQSPEDRHAFAHRYRESLQIMSLPELWLRLRAQRIRYDRS